MQIWRGHRACLWKYCLL
ncbi:hypothetical protein E2F50_01525 [Rhizobium deserti]|uniref:Uncharacterized protein n=1 Tax=Rhizobium deserti TaxID=2547961 RepID=A0A4R5UP82_9HYPH|nr:hypothetical protein E2F50_01525 [Rhizobium deserti]